MQPNQHSQVDFNSCYYKLYVCVCVVCYIDMDIEPFNGNVFSLFCFQWYIIQSISAALNLRCGWRFYEPTEKFEQTHKTDDSIEKYVTSHSGGELAK